ncbi:DegT/DnrJ/EryC1/StrS family aminotransferase [Clostridiaceae bacterium]|nr:DegT/DnrJ/EryC1/StrS family aminotransferase [Clostridiaceae bacterium]
MEFRDLKKQYETLKPSIDAAIREVISNSAFISGPQVKELESRLAAYAGRRHCITCGNGTDALSMMLMAWNIKAGDAVFVPDFTFFATAEVASFEGATPVFVDVDEDTFNMDPVKLKEAIEAVLGEGKLIPRVVIPVDLFGLPYDYPAIRKIADKYGLKILEDAAQGFGGMLREKRACSLGDASATSFFPAKPLGCYGDGGAVFTDDDGTAAYLESIRAHGKGSYKYENIRIGWNSRLDTIQAAVMLPKLEAFREYELLRVNKAAGQYTEGLKSVVKTPVIPEGYLSGWAQYTIQLENEEERNRLQAYLKGKGIPALVYYPIPMHQQKAFSGEKLYGECPAAERLCRRVLSLPMHPYLEKREIEAVIKEIRDFF